MKLKPIFPGQTVTQDGQRPSAELVEVIDRLVRAVGAQDAAIAALEARVAALEALHP